MNTKIQEKLQTFISKYYLNRMFEGLVFSLSLLLLCFVGLSVLEFFGWHSPLVRTIIFYGFVLFAAYVLIIRVIVPLLKLCSIGKRLSEEQAARIIGQHFPEVKDKLLNLLQLQQSALNEDSSLLLAAIQQKTETLSPIPFNHAINKEKLKKGCKIFGIILICLLIALLIFPKLFTEPTHRYLHHNTYFEKPAPFTFIPKDKQMSALKQSDYTVEVRVEGSILPDKVNILVDAHQFEMKKKDRTHFSYTIKQIQQTTKIQFLAADVRSKEYMVVVNPVPVITSFVAKVNYPAYTNIPSQTLENVTNISIPKGTKIQWILKSKDCEQIIFKMANNQQVYHPIKNKCELTTTYLKSQDICIKSKNKYSLSSDSISFSINVIEDERPQIAVIEQRDSLITEQVFFRGQIRDDYGFSKLEFNLKCTAESSDKPRIFKEKINIANNTTTQEFYYMIDLRDMQILAGDKIEYYFEVWDNDAVNGVKSTKSQTFIIDIPSEKDIEQTLEKNNKEIKTEANKALSEIQKLQKQIEELTKKLAQKKELSWQDKKELEQIKEKQERIKQELSDIQKKMQENSAMEEKYSDIDEELMQKQEELEKLFNQLENKDLKELMQKLDELMQKNMDKDKVSEALKQLQDKNQDLSKELDKSLELFKRLDVEKDINQAIDKLNELSKKQEDLAKETQNSKQDKESLSKKQEQINKDFQDLQKKMEEIKKKDQSLEDPFNFDPEKEKQQQIKQEQQKAKEEIDKKNNKQAAKNQRSAAKKMQEMAEKMEQDQEQQNQEQLAEDIDQVRQILKNLVTLSKNQEDLIYLTQQTSVSDPAYQKIINKQNSIKVSMQDVADSLYNISKRQPQVSRVITEQNYNVSQNIEKSLATLLKFNQSTYNNFKNNQAANSQQAAMTAMNNLSVLLAESLNNMNQQQQKSKNQKGNPKQNCSNPSQGKSNKPSIKNMRQMQEALNKEIERLQKELEKQGNQPKQKIGEGAKLSEQLAKAAAQQEMIRKMMQQYLQQEKQNSGGKNKIDDKAIKQMEQTEQDIVNKKITAQTLKRQNEILTRMLQSEKAEKTQEKDNQRKSNTGVDRQNENIENFEAFKKLKNRDIDLFKKIPPVYSTYYNLKVSKYFYNFENSKSDKN